MAETDLPRMLEIAGRLLVTETTNEARLEVAAAAGVKRVQFSAIIDGRTSPLCRHLDGKVFPAGSPEAARFQPPLHINCRSIWIEVGDDEVGAVDAFDPADPELPDLVQKHGHFVRDPEKYSPLRIPASPASRDFVFRRWKDAKTGAMVSDLEWKRPRYELPGLDETTIQRGVRKVGPRWTRLDRGDGGGGDDGGGSFLPPKPKPPKPKPPAPPAKPAWDTTGAGARRNLKRVVGKAEREQAKLLEQREKLWTELEALYRRADAAEPATMARIKRLQQEARQVHQRSVGLRDAAIQRWREEVLFVDPAEASTLDCTFDTTVATVRARRQKGVETFRRMVRRGTGLDDQVVAVDSLPRGDNRAHCKANGLRICLAPESSTKTVVHELGHCLEKLDPQIDFQARAFLAKRAGDAEPRSLRELTGVQAYDEDEVAWEDEFINPYMGKRYEGGATEIVSMGAQYLYEDPVELATKDPGYFDFIWGILRGGASR